MMDLLWMFGAICVMLGLFIENEDIKRACGYMYRRYTGISNSLLLIGCVCFVISLALELMGI